MMSSYGSMGWAGWLLNGLVLIGLWAVLVGAVIMALRAWRGDADTQDRADSQGRADTTQLLLAERFARGEIDGPSGRTGESPVQPGS